MQRSTQINLDSMRAARAHEKGFHPQLAPSIHRDGTRTAYPPESGLGSRHPQPPAARHACVPRSRSRSRSVPSRNVCSQQAVYVARPAHMQRTWTPQPGPVGPMHFPFLYYLYFLFLLVGLMINLQNKAEISIPSHAKGMFGSKLLKFSHFSY